VSILVGLALAGVYHLIAVRLPARLSKRAAGLMPLLTIAGFLGRLTFFAVVLVLLALFSPLNILATALAFIGLFTILSAVWLFLLLTKRSAPPSAGPTGAK
jgi:hypothetical protein